MIWSFISGATFAALIALWLYVARMLLREAWVSGERNVLILLGVAFWPITGTFLISFEGVCWAWRKGRKP